MTMCEHVVARPREGIGVAVQRFLESYSPIYTVQVIAVIPRILAFYATSPERYEVREADVLFYSLTEG